MTEEPGPQVTPVEPYIPHTTSLPEITVKAILLGVGLSILLAIPIVMFKGENPMDIGARVSWLPSVWPGAVLLLGVMYLLYRTARK